VALALDQSDVRLSATGGAWSLYDRTGEHLIAQARSGDEWTVQRDGNGLRADGGHGFTTRSLDGPLIARPQESATVLIYNGKPYRGELLVMKGDDGLIVVNRLSLETYLRGVVPLEIGTDRTADEEAAVEAQAIAARSYAYMQLNDSRPYDLGATVMDQVYGGARAERPIANQAITATRGLVLLYEGKVISAPYHANSGGITAAASEVWRTDDEPYLTSVSDRIPGTDRYYDEDSPKFSWTRTFDADELQADLERYLRKYAEHAPRGSIGRLRRIVELGHSQSGRVSGLLFETTGGRFEVRRNNIRFVLRTHGEILPSTLFTLDTDTDHSGYISRLVIHGRGNGHGVGMDQWGAIARARAGQDFRTILGTYYPGTTVGPLLTHDSD
jgi:stage II sporulation protein D